MPHLTKRDQSALRFMRRVGVALASSVPVLAWIMTAPVLAADGIQPGLWKITTEIVNNGMRLPPQTHPRCLTAEQADDLASTFSPRFGGVNTTCTRTEYSKSEQKLTWRLECRGQVNMDSAAEFTFFSSLRYTAVIATKGWMGNQVIADTQMALEGTYLGACQ
jgi:hypothetical protein